MDNQAKAEVVFRRPGPDLELTLARPGDSRTIIDMTAAYLQALGLDRDTGGLDRDLADPLRAYRQGGFILARRRGVVIGCCGLRILEPGLGEIKRMYVDSSCRGLGLGRAVLEAVIDLARALELSRLVLDTRLDLTAANRLYESVGFMDIPDYNANPRAGRFMALDLQAGRRRPGGEPGPAD